MCKFNLCFLKFIRMILVILSLLTFIASFILMCLNIGVYDQNYIKNLQFFGDLSIYLLLFSLFTHNLYIQVKNTIVKKLTNIIPTRMEDDEY
jgi:hypothetical protein